MLSCVSQDICTGGGWIECRKNEVAEVCHSKKGVKKDFLEWEKWSV